MTESTRNTESPVKILHAGIISDNLDGNYANLVEEKELKN